MKNSFTVLLTFFAFSTTLFSQDISDNTIGLRLGDSDGFGAEISYQRGLNDTKRLEFDLGWRDAKIFKAIKLTGLYQWVMPLEGNFNWYVGAGGGLGKVDFKNNATDDTTFLFATGDIGIEYDFDFPLLLSLDFRPELGLSGYNDFENNLDFDIALGIRYQF